MQTPTATGQRTKRPARKALVLVSIVAVAAVIAAVLVALRSEGKPGVIRVEAAAEDGSSTTSPSDPAGSDQDAVQESFALAVDAYQSLTSPPPSSQSNANGPSATSPVAVKNGLPALSDDERTSPMAHQDPTSGLGILSDDALASWHATARQWLNTLYGPRLAKTYLAVVDRAALGEASDTAATTSNGSHLPSNRFLGGGGGASVEKFESVSVSGDEAKVSATVSLWLRLGTVDLKSGDVSWSTSRGDEQVDASLIRSQDGVWRIDTQTVSDIPQPDDSTTPSSTPDSAQNPSAPTSS